MAQAPQVQSLDQIMAELNPANTQQTNLIRQQQAGLGEQFKAQQGALDATKAQEMNTINTQAAGKGMAFSGVPIDEQLTYLGTKYLPAVANLKASQNNANTSLEQQLADIYSNTYKSAYDTRQNQQASQNQWNLAQMQNEFSAAEAERNRQFQASQNAAEDTTPTADQYIANTFASLGSMPEWKESGATENSGLIGTLSTSFINPVTGKPYTVAEAKKKVYDFRKSVYEF